MSKSSTISSLPQSLLRLSTAGSVDDGKSTLIGRLLFDCGSVYEDYLIATQKTTRRIGLKEEQALALITDGLRAELEQGITIDVAYRYFSTPKRRFILADTPGHEQYTRNMATGASTADLCIILIDASKGVLPQTKRHAFIASLMGVPRLLIAVNKMDLVNYSQSVFNHILDDFSIFSSKLGIQEVYFIPICALHGDNVATPSRHLGWYHGSTLLNYLETVHVSGDGNHVDFRFPVQYVLRYNGTSRAYAGQVVSGAICTGEEIIVLPSMRRSIVRSIQSWEAELQSKEQAEIGQSISLVLEDDLDIGRGDILVRPNNIPHQRHHFEAMIVWLDDVAMDMHTEYLLRHTTQETKCYIDDISYRIDINTLKRIKAAPLQLNEIGRLAFTSVRSLSLDTYKQNRATGNFILICPTTFNTVAAGMVIDRLPEDYRTKISFDKRVLHKEYSLVSADERVARALVHPITVWLIGLSGSGKSSLAREVERSLFNQQQLVFCLDGDNLRLGLNRDLGFSREDRRENLRRAAEVAKLMNQAGVTVLASFITPFEDDRQNIRQIVGDEQFLLVYLDTSLEVCEARDPYGLYSKSRRGELREFTGISSPFETPLNYDLKLDTGEISLHQCTELLLSLMLPKMKL